MVENSNKAILKLWWRNHETWKDNCAENIISDDIAVHCFPAPGTVDSTMTLVNPLPNPAPFTAPLCGSLNIL